MPGFQIVKLRQSALSTVLILFAAFSASAVGAEAGTVFSYEVNSPLDAADLASLAGNGRCELREAVESANTGEDVDTCAWNFGHYSIYAREPIRLVAPLVVTGNLDLYNPSSTDTSVIDGQASTHHFIVEPGGELSLRNIELIDGYNEEGAGSIHSRGTLYLRDTILAYNQGTEGGALNLAGPFYIDNTLFASNSAEAGGAIFVDASEDLPTVTGSLFWKNNAASGSAVYFSDEETYGGYVYLSKSTILSESDSTAIDTGGLDRFDIYVLDSSIYRASPSDRPLISGGDFRIINSSILDDASSLVLDGSGYVENTAIYADPSSLGCSADIPIAYSASNLETCGEIRLLNIPPVFADHGGHLPTLSFGTNSLLIDQGDESAHPYSEGTESDNRGEESPRVSGEGIDIGALEYNGVQNSPPTVKASSFPVPTMGSVSISAASLPLAQDNVMINPESELLICIFLNGESYSVQAADESSLPRGFRDGSRPYKAIHVTSGQEISFDPVPPADETASRPQATLEFKPCEGSILDTGAPALQSEGGGATYTFRDPPNASSSGGGGSISLFWAGLFCLSLLALRRTQTTV